MCVRAQLQMIYPSEVPKSHFTTREHHKPLGISEQVVQWIYKCTSTGLVHPLYPYTVDGSALERHPELAEGYCGI